MRQSCFFITCFSFIFIFLCLCISTITIGLFGVNIIRKPHDCTWQVYVIILLLLFLCHWLCWPWPHSCLEEWKYLPHPQLDIIVLINALLIMSYLHKIHVIVFICIFSFFSLLSMTTCLHTLNPFTMKTSCLDVFFQWFQWFLLYTKATCRWQSKDFKDPTSSTCCRVTWKNVLAVLR